MQCHIPSCDVSIFQIEMNDFSDYPKVKPFPVIVEREGIEETRQIEDRVWKIFVPGLTPNTTYTIRIFSIKKEFTTKP